MIPGFLSIIIINFNTYDFTRKCIESIYKKTREVSFEIILVDNDSRECDPEVFRQLFPELILVKSAKNLGFAGGNNLGIKHARGEYILLLNSDMELKNNVPGILLASLKDQSKTGVLTGKLIYPDGKLQHNCQSFPNWKKGLFELFRLQKIFRKFGRDFLAGPFFSYDRPIYCDWVWGTMFLFRKRDLELLPGSELSEDFFMYGEDMQWCYEFQRAGKKIAFCPEALAVHYVGGSNAQREDLMRAHLKVFMKKYYSSGHRWIIEKINRMLD